MRLELAEVEHIAELVKLELTGDEKAIFQVQLSAILDYAATLQAVDTSGVPPTTSVFELSNVTREDAVLPSLPREDVLANAPDPHQGCFRVRAILE
jgi:aspartyl-tRNA(Asn)/glutamyl-tRNA(Gln) amidotransferase subunit C